MKTILIVEDEPEQQGLIATYIANFTNYKTIVAEDGEVAIDLVRENRPDLILIDLMLPRIGGIALYRDLRKMENSKDTPIIFMSGMMTDEVLQKEGIEMGAVDYITKPIDFKRLFEKFEAILGKNDPDD